MNKVGQPETDQQPRRIARGGRSVGGAILFACLMLFSAELALQVRSQIRTGESVFSSLRGNTKYFKNAELQLRTLRPSAVIEGAHQVIRTNRYGLRGDDFDPTPPSGEIRIAQLGASTIQGAFARDTYQTSSAALQRRLAAHRELNDLRVINAGLDGTSISGQARLLDRMLVGLGVRLVIWYPGTNDIGCKPSRPLSSAPPIRMPWPALPRWTLSDKLIVLNTTFLRKSYLPSNQTLIKDFDLSGMRASIERGIGISQSNGIALVLVTSATSYRSTMPEDEISRRASTALFFRPCLTGPELAASVDAFNQMLREVAAARRIPLIDAAQLMPAEPRLFGDANHFSAEGEEHYAQLIADELLRSKLLARQSGPIAP